MLGVKQLNQKIARSTHLIIHASAIYPKNKLNNKGQQSLPYIKQILTDSPWENQSEGLKLAYH